MTLPATGAAQVSPADLDFVKRLSSAVMAGRRPTRGHHPGAVADLAAECWQAEWGSAAAASMTPAATASDNADHLAGDQIES